jgi:hypothetical protein
MKNAIRTLSILSVCLILGACGISGNLRGDPGYAAFESPGMRDTDRSFALSLGPLPLKLARTFMDEDDEDAARILKHLDAVRIYIYEVDGNPDRVMDRMQTTRDRLVAKGWEPAIATREDGGLVNVMVKMGGEQAIRGMVVMSLDGNELVLVNLIGEIRPEMFNSYMTELDVDTPDVDIDASGP